MECWFSTFADETSPATQLCLNYPWCHIDQATVAPLLLTPGVRHRDAPAQPWRTILTNNLGLTPFTKNSLHGKIRFAMFRAIPAGNTY